MLNYLWAGMILLGIVYAVLTGNVERITDAALDSAGEAISLCITMSGVMAFWMGLMALILAYDNISQKTLTYITSVMCGLLVFTLYNRIVSALREVNK